MESSPCACERCREIWTQLDIRATWEQNSSDVRTAFTIVSLCRRLVCAMQLKRANLSEQQPHAQTHAAPSVFAKHEDTQPADDQVQPCNTLRHKKRRKQQQKHQRSNAPQRSTTHNITFMQLECSRFGPEDAALGPDLHGGSQFLLTAAACMKHLGLCCWHGLPPAPFSSHATKASLADLSITAIRIRPLMQSEEAPELHSITMQLQASHAMQVATGVRQLLAMWYPTHISAHQPSTLLPLQDSRMRACASHVIPMHSSSWHDMDEPHAGTLELLCHVIGSGHATGPDSKPGAAGLRYVHRLQWQPYDATQPSGRGQLVAVLTDGLGVWLVVVMRDLWLVQAGRGARRRPPSQAKVQRKEAGRRERRAMAVQAALRAAGELEQELSGWRGGVAVFAGICVSLAEGLEVVAAQGGRVKRQEQRLAQALIPGMVLGQSGLMTGLGNTWHGLVDWATGPWVGKGERGWGMVRTSTQDVGVGGWLMVGGIAFAVGALFLWSRRSL